MIKKITLYSRQVGLTPRRCHSANHRALQKGYSSHSMDMLCSYSHFM